MLWCWSLLITFVSQPPLLWAIYYGKILGSRPIRLRDLRPMSAGTNNTSLSFLFCFRGTDWSYFGFGVVYIGKTSGLKKNVWKLKHTHQPVKSILRILWVLLSGISSTTSLLPSWWFTQQRGLCRMQFVPNFLLLLCKACTDVEKTENVLKLHTAIWPLHSE